MKKSTFTLKGKGGRLFGVYSTMHAAQVAAQEKDLLVYTIVAKEVPREQIVSPAEGPLSIGLCPTDKLGIKGRTAEARVLNLVKRLAMGNDVSQRDAKDIRATLHYIIEGDVAAPEAYGNLDTAVRDTFAQAFTADGTDKRATRTLAKVTGWTFHG